MVGKATDGRITNGSGTFLVLQESRSRVELTKGAPGDLGLAVVGVGAEYGTLNRLQQLGRELPAVVGFIG